MGQIVSVIVPIYNTEKYLKFCIESILNQTYREIQLILINDGSTDRSGEICKKYLDIDDRIIVIDQENQGVSVARNCGLNAAIGQLIMFVDSDDVIEERALEVLVTDIECYSVDVAICKLVQNRSEKKTRQKILVFDKITALQNLLENRPFGGSLVHRMFRRDAIADVRLDPNIFMCEDLLFNWEVFKKCNLFLYDPNVDYYYHRRNDSVTRMEFTTKILTAIDVSNRICNDVENRFAILKKSYFSHYITIRIFCALKILCSSNRNGNFYFTILHKEIKGNLVNIVTSHNVLAIHKFFSLIFIFPKKFLLHYKIVFIKLYSIVKLK